MRNVETNEIFGFGFDLFETMAIVEIARHHYFKYIVRFKYDFIEIINNNSKWIECNKHAKIHNEINFNFSAIFVFVFVSVDRKQLNFHKTFLRYSSCWTLTLHMWSFTLHKSCSNHFKWIEFTVWKNYNDLWKKEKEKEIIRRFNDQSILFFYLFLFCFVFFFRREFLQLVIGCDIHTHT